MDLGNFFGWYTLTECTDLIARACQVSWKSINDAKLIPWYFYFLCAAMGGVFIGINVVFVLSLARGFIRRVDEVLESFATMIERVTKGLENTAEDEEGPVTAEERQNGTAYYPLEIAKAFIYLVDQILERLVMMGNALMEGGNSTVAEIPVRESRLEMTIRELLIEWEEEDKNRVERKKKKEEMVQRDEKAGEGSKASSGRKLVTAGMGGSQVGGVSEGSLNHAVTIPQQLLVIIGCPADLNIERLEDCHWVQFSTWGEADWEF